VFSDLLQEALLEAKAYPHGIPSGTKANVGDSSKWSSGWHVKVNEPDKWTRQRKGRAVLSGLRPDSKPETRARATKEMAKLPGTMTALRKLYKEGGTDPKIPSFHKLVGEAINQVRLADARRPFLEDEIEAADPTGVVTSRTKTLESTIGKVVRQHHKFKEDKNGDEILDKDGEPVFDMDRPDLDRASKLKDSTGVRTAHGSIDEVYAAAERLQKHFGDKITKFQDRIKKSKDGYRALHFDFTDKDGVTKELQIITHNQASWANWNHAFYKPEDELQQDWKKGTDKEIIAQFKDYGQAMSDHFFRVDSGKESKVPDCPEIVANSPFRCM